MLFSNKFNFENSFSFIKKLNNDRTQKLITLPSLFLGPRPSAPLFVFSFVLLLTFKIWAGGDIDTLKKELAANPENLKLRHSLAQIHFDQGRYEATVEVFKTKAEKLPQESLALLSMAYQKLDDPINELKFLEQLTANYPKFPNGFVMLGDFYYKKSLTKSDARQTANTLAAYKSAIEINPNYRPAYDGLLKSYEKYNNFYELRILLEDMVKRFGKTGSTLSQLCRRNAIDGYFVNARKTCSEAITLDSKNPENYVFLSLVENNEGQTAKADVLLKKVTSDFPQSEIAASNYGDFLIQQKNLPGAENFFQQAAKADSNSFRAHIGLAIVGFELKHYESALTAYKNACKTNPHQAMKYLKRATDLLRHRRENRLENQYTNVITNCTVSRDNDRSPASIASLKEEFRSAFALYSKNKNINLGL